MGGDVGIIRRVGIEVFLDEEAGEDLRRVGAKNGFVCDGDGRGPSDGQNGLCAELRERIGDALGAFGMAGARVAGCKRRLKSAAGSCV